MDDNLRGAVDEWENDKTDEIATPLDAPSYAVPQQDEAERLVKLDGPAVRDRAGEEQGG